MNDIILHLGSNQGLRHRYLLRARQLLQLRLGKELACSATYETSAWGEEEQAAFLNIALHYQTELTPLAALELVLKIELELGRERHYKWGPRCIDIDLIFYNDLVVDHPRLQLPHPWLQDRRFVLVPLTDVASAWLHPLLGATVAELLTQCQDQGKVIRVS